MDGRAVGHIIYYIFVAVYCLKVVFHRHYNYHYCSAIGYYSFLSDM